MPNALPPLSKRIEDATSAAKEAISALPPPDDLAFEKSLSRELTNKLDGAAAELLETVQAVVEWINPVLYREVHANYALIREGFYSDMTGLTDDLLERADKEIDGRDTTKVSIISSTQPGGPPVFNTPAKDPDALDMSLRYADIPPPQRLFTDPYVIDPAAYPFEYEALPASEPYLAPLWSSPKTAGARLRLIQPKALAAFLAPAPPFYVYEHPFADVLQTLSPPASLRSVPALQSTARLTVASFNTVPFTYVDSVDKLEEAFSAILASPTKELAVDVEHNEVNSWAGIVCLVQMSTREADYVFDTLVPEVRASFGRLFSQIFEDPQWIKVFHGPYMDNVWLQRDFGLYIIGLFDTFSAMTLLKYPRRSLQFLLERFTDFHPDKRYQRADWRIRPLPTEMLHYARGDTHFLLNMYDLLRIELLEMKADEDKKEVVTEGTADQEPSKLPENADGSKSSSKDDSESGSDSEAESLPLDLSAAAASAPSTDLLARVWKMSTEVTKEPYHIVPTDPIRGYGPSGWLLPLLKKNRFNGPIKNLDQTEEYGRFIWGAKSDIKLALIRKLFFWREQKARQHDIFAKTVVNEWALVNLVNAATDTWGENDVLTSLRNSCHNYVSATFRQHISEVMEILKEVFAAQRKTPFVDVTYDWEPQEVSALEPSEITTNPATGLWGDAVDQVYKWAEKSQLFGPYLSATVKKVDEKAFVKVHEELMKSVDDSNNPATLAMEVDENGVANASSKPYFPAPAEEKSEPADTENPDVDAEFIIVSKHKEKAEGMNKGRWQKRKSSDSDDNLSESEPERMPKPKKPKKSNSTAPLPEGYDPSKSVLDMKVTANSGKKKDKKNKGNDKKAGNSFRRPLRAPTKKGEKSKSF